MNIIFRISVLLISISFFSSVQSEIKFSDRVESYTLSNGLKVVLIEDKRSPSVVNSIWYKVGSSHEASGKTGISHVLEHMMFKGTKTLKPGEFSSIVKKMGGTENAFTSKDYTGYFQKIHTTDLERCIELESDRMKNLRLDGNELRSEIEVVKEERRLRTDDNPVSKTFEKIMINAYGMNEYGIPIIGTMQNLGSISKNDLENWYKLHYQPKNAIAIIAGNFNADQVKGYIQKYYGRYENNKSSIKPNNKIEFSTKASFDVYDKVSKPIVFLSFKKPKFDKNRIRELYALDLFIEIMDGGYSSRLTKNLVDNQKVALDIFLSNDTYNQYPNLIIIGGTPRGKISPEELKLKILEQLSNESINSVTERELVNAKARVKANNIYKFDSVFYQAMQVGMLETKDIGWENLDNYNSITESISLNEVKESASKYFLNNKVFTTILRPEK
ncbi:MAG: insulinase family protein [Gammaproteobacteria bacterium]|nr:insulinase family protein [Gammaproteobacteria bacterium]MBL6898339.1 insulinase family protein [Gammaproteobacteria bacterium]